MTTRSPCSGRMRLAGGVVIRALVPGADRARGGRGGHRAGGGHARAAPRGRLLRGPAAPIAGLVRLHRCARSNAGGTWEVHDPYRYPPVLGDIDDYLIREGTHRRLWERLGAHAIEHAGVEGRPFRGLGAQRHPRVGGRRLQRLGRPAQPDAPSRQRRRLGDLHPRARRGRALQVRDRAPPTAACCR